MPMTAVFLLPISATTFSFLLKRGLGPHRVIYSQLHPNAGRTPAVLISGGMLRGLTGSRPLLGMMSTDRHMPSNGGRPIQKGRLQPLEKDILGRQLSLTVLELYSGLLLDSLCIHPSVGARPDPFLAST